MFGKLFKIATVGWTAKEIEDGIAQGEIHTVQLSTNPRAKMMGFEDGFVKLFARTGSGTVIGGVVVYRQVQHVTQTYARSMAPFLEPEVTAAVEAARAR